MSIVGSAWEIQQTLPPNKTITLNGYQAPFGRLRKNPVIDTEFELRETEVYYGGQRKPTRLIFGDKESPIILHGRWSDRYIGTPGGALALRDSMKQLVADQVNCTVKWGSIVAYSGLPSKLRIGVETSADLAWELTIKVDEDLNLRKQVPALDGIPQSPLTSVDGFTVDFAKWVANIGLVDNFLTPDLEPSFLDSLTSLVQSVRSAVAKFYDATADMDAYISATNAQLSALLSAISACNSALQNVQEAIDTTAIDAIVYYRTAEADFNWVNYKLQSDLATDDLLYDLATMKLQVQLAQRGTNQVTVVAQSGDTWESIAIRVYGQADGATTLARANGVATLRQANSVTYGTLPVVGQTYIVPLTALDF